MLIHTTRCFLTIFLFIAVFQGIDAQDIFIEVGAGIGNSVGQKNSRGKGELHFSILKSYQFGQLGLDFSSGGNFIPGITSIEDENMETLPSNDFKFTTIMAFYRLPIKKHFFIESRLGYSSLFSFVHTEDKTKISQPNFTAGITLGGQVNNFILSLKYQYLGVTPNYSGIRNTTIVKSNSKSLAVLLFRISYRFNLNDLF